MKLRKPYLSLLVLAILAVTVMTVYAGLTFREASASVSSIKGSFVYVGGGTNDTVVAKVTVVGYGLTATCANPANKIAPGQTAFDITYEPTPQTFSADKSGRVEGSYYYDIKPSVETAGCPNGKWTVSDLQGLVTVTLRVENISKGDFDQAIFECNLNVDGPCTQIQ